MRDFDIGGAEIGSSVAGDIGITEIVDKDENDVWRSLTRFAQQLAGSSGKCCRT